MSISSAQLETLQRGLNRLATMIANDPRSMNAALGVDDPLVTAAAECEFLLPSTLTLAALSETVGNKRDTVATLLERAKMHESLPPEAQTAAEEENAFIEEDYESEPEASNDLRDQRQR